MSHPHHHMYDLCKKHMHAYVLVEMEDGNQIDGIIADIDDENVYLAVPIGQGGSGPYPGGPDFRGFGYGFPGYPGYGYGYPGYGYGYRPRRFNRLILPLAALTALSVLPYF